MVCMLEGRKAGDGGKRMAGVFALTFKSYQSFGNANGKTKSAAESNEKQKAKWAFIKWHMRAL